LLRQGVQSSIQDPLPNDIAALRALLVSQGAELAAKRAELTELRQTIRHRELFIEKLKVSARRCWIPW
jgi:hypothetical protein